jgi:hypothetical protein
VSGGGEDAFGNGEGSRVELEDGNIAEGVDVGVEVLVVKDAVGAAWVLLTEDPLTAGMLEGLGGFAFDDVAQRFLPTIGLGQVQLVEHEE